MAQGRDNQGQFEKGSKAAREAGRKGGESSHSGGRPPSNRSSDRQKEQNK